MASLTSDPSPQAYARIGGALYLIIIVGGLLGEVLVRSTLIVPGKATVTAERILASESLWRASAAGEFFMLACSVVLGLIFYVLLRPVSRDLALLVLLFNLIAIAVEAVNELNLLATLWPLATSEYLKVFSQEQLHALAHLPTRTYVYGFGVGLIFFGCECLVLGYLIFRSGYLPKTVGILMSIAGACYLINSFALIVSPALAGSLYPVILIPPFIGEASLCLWLLAKGVDAAGWTARLGGPSAPAAAPGIQAGTSLDSPVRGRALSE